MKKSSVEPYTSPSADKNEYDIRTRIQISIRRLHTKDLPASRIIAAILLMSAAALLVSCTADRSTADRSIDKNYYTDLCGDYQAVEQLAGNEEDHVGGWWHLYIGEGDDGKEYLSIYDNEAGNPGVEGEIVTLNENIITININDEYYEEMPSSHWKEEGGRLVLNYGLTGSGVEITNNGYTVMFVNDDGSE